MEKSAHTVQHTNTEKKKLTRRADIKCGAKPCALLFALHFRA